MPDIPLEQLLGCVFLPGYADAEIHQDRIPEERPEQCPQAVTAVAEVTDHPPRHQEPLKRPDQNNQVVGSGVFGDGELHESKNLSGNGRFQGIDIITKQI